MAEQRAFDIPTFCQKYGIGRIRTYEEIREKRLVAVKVGRRTLIRASDADAWLAALMPADRRP